VAGFFFDTIQWAAGTKYRNRVIYYLMADKWLYGQNRHLPSKGINIVISQMEFETLITENRRLKRSTECQQLREQPPDVL